MKTATKDTICLYKKRHSTKGPGPFLRRQLRECLTSHGYTDSWRWNKTGTKKQPRTFNDKKALQLSKEQMNSITQSIQDKRMPFDISDVNRCEIKWKTKNGWKLLLTIIFSKSFKTSFSDSSFGMFSTVSEDTEERSLLPDAVFRWGRGGLSFLLPGILMLANLSSYERKMANKSIFSHASTLI